jgi:hypothetical protein
LALFFMFSFVTSFGRDESRPYSEKMKSLLPCKIHTSVCNSGNLCKFAN